MKLEYFKDACEGRGLLLLYGGSPADLECLRAAVRKLMIAGTTVQLHKLQFVETVSNCGLTAGSIPRGGGVRRLSPSTFCWELSPSEWKLVDGLLEPFCSAAAETGVRFQYLNHHPGIEVIYSTRREW